jgi:hypothetical protein
MQLIILFKELGTFFKKSVLPLELLIKEITLL